MPPRKVYLGKTDQSYQEVRKALMASMATGEEVRIMDGGWGHLRFPQVMKELCQSIEWKGSKVLDQPSHQGATFKGDST